MSKEDYDSCNTSNPIKHYNDGNTKVRFDHSGPYYYISGEKGHCEKGQKLTVVVMSLRGGSRPIVAFSPAPSPVEVEGPAGSAVAPAPTSGATVLQGGGVFVAMGLVLAMWLFWFELPYFSLDNHNISIIRIKIGIGFIKFKRQSQWGDC